MFCFPKSRINENGGKDYSIMLALCYQTHAKVLIGPLQLSHHVTYFHKIMRYNQKWKKHVQNIKMAKFEAPIIKQ